MKNAVVHDTTSLADLGYSPHLEQRKPIIWVQSTSSVADPGGYVFAEKRPRRTLAPRMRLASRPTENPGSATGPEKLPLRCRHLLTFIGTTMLTPYCP